MSDTSKAKRSFARDAAAAAAPALGLLGGVGALVGGVLAASGGAGALVTPFIVAGAASGLGALLGGVVERELRREKARRPLVFISYARDHAGEARALLEAIEKTGTRTWLDFASLRPGEPWAEAIENAVRAADAVIVLGSSDPGEDHVATEVQAAKRLGKRLLFVQFKGRGDSPAEPRGDQALFWTSDEEGLNSLATALHDAAAAAHADNSDSAEG